MSVWASPETHLCSQGSLKRVENCFFISPKEPWKSLVKAHSSISRFLSRQAAASWGAPKTMPQVCDRSIGKGGKTSSDVLEEVPVPRLSKLTYVDEGLKEKILAPLHDSGVSWQNRGFLKVV